jgi:hypothetical protein
MNSSGSRLKWLAVLCILAMLAGLWLAARDGDLLSAVVLAVFAAILLVALGLTAAIFILYVVSRINQPATESVRDMADAQRSMAGAMATWGRATNQLPAGGVPLPLPGAAGGYGSEILKLPALTEFRHAEEEGNGQEIL